jgi:hypothetical protein
VTDEYLAALRADRRGSRRPGRLLAGSSPPAEKLRQLQALPGATGAAIKAYLDLVSHRVVGGYDIGCPTAIETPEILVGALQVKHSPEAEAKAAEEVKRHIAKVREAVPEAKRAEFDEVLHEARTLNRLRDERGYWSDLWASGISRRAIPRGRAGASPPKGAIQAGRARARRHARRIAGAACRRKTRSAQQELAERHATASPCPTALRPRP